MKLKKGYIMKELAGRYVVLPVGGEPEGFQGMIQMNVTGGFLWECLSEERTKQELIDLLKVNTGDHHSVYPSIATMFIIA